MLQQISDSELELMKIIWRNNGTALYAFIMTELEKGGCEWKKNTVLTLLSRLVEKGFLSTSKIGRRNEYTALVSEADYLTTQTKSFVEKVYEGDVSGLVTTLIQQDILSSDDIEKLQAYWRKKLNE
jgi:predicted transcriptional regulator